MRIQSIGIKRALWLRLAIIVIGIILSGLALMILDHSEILALFFGLVGFILTCVGVVLSFSWLWRNDEK